MSDFVNSINFSLGFNWGAEFTEEPEVDFLKQYGLQLSDFDGDISLGDSDSVSKQSTTDPSDTPSKEFLELSDDAVLNFIQNEENPGTMKKTLLDVNKFERFLTLKKMSTGLFTPSPPMT